jgi:hypothetical protein
MPTFATSSSSSLPPTSSDKQQSLNPLTIASGEICHHGLWSWSTSTQFHNGPLYCPGGIRTWSPAKSHLKYNCLKLPLKTLFTRICRCEVIPPGMTTRSLHKSQIRSSVLSDLQMHPAQAFLVFSTMLLVSCSDNL